MPLQDNDPWAVSMSDAMPDPRPRVTNRIGNAQQTRIVAALVSPTTALRRSRRMTLLSLVPESLKSLYDHRVNLGFAVFVNDASR
jgi:hypothetical protein